MDKSSGDGGNVFLVRLVQVYESFRRAELEAIADLLEFKMDILDYNDDSPFCLVRLPSIQNARALISRTIIAHAIYVLWGSGSDYPSLRTSVREQSAHLWAPFAESSFRFEIDSFRGKRSMKEQRSIIESFSWLPLNGPIVMRGAELTLTVFEDWAAGDQKRRSQEQKPDSESQDPESAIASSSLPRPPQPKRLYLGQLIAESGRSHALAKYDLKKRVYVSTTSFAAEIALVTANMAHAAPGRLLYDPLAGTGSLPVACAHFGAMTCGSDIDGRMIRGKGGRRSVVGNFEQYGFKERWLDGWVSDLTNSPLRGLGDEEATRRAGWLDGIVCDPPYGVREGCKTLGKRREERNAVVEGPVYIDGKLSHLLDGYVPPKKPYSFDAMLDDILEFAAVMLVENGRLAMWVPTANENNIALVTPMHPHLELVSECIQSFNKWSRRLLTYRRLRAGEIDRSTKSRKRTYGTGVTANELNSFRKKYFEGFKPTQS
ncbi:RNA methylase family protein [Lineolata rhizophorae]|uniref:tRNA (guanine(10)-N(2))-methyltransferase n=1 Tax=Lineolata rhizophorae TaxID=578093 RepID=A0A6A6PA59_9PEZI|nr:RNA methylase family protein [Lineolata rhizophorae]